MTSRDTHDHESTKLGLRKRIEILVKQAGNLLL
jgi:hypothetical protein